MSSTSLRVVFTPEDARQMAEAAKQHQAIPARPKRLGVVATLSLMAFGAILGAAIELSSEQAHADTGDADAMRVAIAVCSSIDQKPTVGGVEDVVEALVAKGATGEQAGRIIALSVAAACPYDEPILQAFARAYAPDAPAAPAPAPSTNAGWAV